MQHTNIHIFQTNRPTKIRKTKRSTQTVSWPSELLLDLFPDCISMHAWVRTFIGNKQHDMCTCQLLQHSELFPCHLKMWPCLPVIAYEKALFVMAGPIRCTNTQRVNRQELSVRLTIWFRQLKDAFRLSAHPFRLSHSLCWLIDAWAVITWNFSRD